MAQQYIDFGSFPDDPDADAIRTAFQKANTNFTELYSVTTAGTVTSVNRGAGITVNTTTGNVIVTANIACVQVSTSSLSIGQPSNGGTTATITQSSQTMVIDINPVQTFSNSFAAVGGGLANLTGTLTSNSNSQPNITSIGTLANLAVTGNVTAGNVYANTGTIGATSLTGALTTAAQPNITSVGNLTSLNVTGNIRSSAYIGGNVSTTGANAIFVGDGGLLSNLVISAGSSILNGNSNVDVSANGNVTTSVAGNANILIVTGTGINVSGNANVNNLGTTQVIATGNISATQLISNIATGTAPFVVTSTTQVANLNVANAGLAAYATVANSIVLGNVSGAGNIASINLSGNGSQVLYGNGIFGAVSSGSTITNGNSNVDVSANGNVTTSVGGTSNVLIVTSTGINVAGTLNTGSSNANVGNLGATGIIATTLSGSLTTASQTNVTSLGNLSSLTVSGVSNLGPISNVIITGGGSGYFLQTNGSGNLSWNNATLIPAPGNTSEVIYNNLGNYAASSTITVNGSNGYLLVNTLSSTSLIGTLTVSASAQPNIRLVGTLDYLIINSTTGYIAAGNSNIGAGNINLIASGSANLGNLATANFFTGTLTTNAQPNITSVGTLTILTSSGNIQGANIITTGYHVRSVGTGITAAGSSQGTGTALTKEMNIVSTVSSGANGVVLPTAVAGMMVTITNTTANSLLVYPASGGAINSLAANGAFTQNTTTIQFIAPTTTQWYTVGATYA
jgi:hypothetical protein